MASSVAALTACAPGGNTPFRDINAPMGATTRFEAEAFTGRWIVAARFGGTSTAGSEILIETSSSGIEVSGVSVPDVAGTYKVRQPGELIAQNAEKEDLIVMWVDENFETAAIGTFSGRFGALIDRDGIIPPDREQAAKDILEFYGWDVSLLRGVSS